MSEYERWEECPQGLLTGMAEELRRSKRWPNRLGPAFGALLVLLVVGVVGAGYLLTNGLLTDSGSEITCDEVAPLLAQYHRRTLDPATARQVEQHLSVCPHCQQEYEKSFSEEARRRESLVDPVLAMLLLSR